MPREPVAQLTVPESLHLEIKLEATRRGVAMKDFVAELLRRAMDDPRADTRVDGLECK